MKGILSRLAAVFLLSLPMAFIFRRSERFTLARLNSDPAGYIAQRKEIISKAHLGGHFIAVFILGLLVVLSIEVVAFLVRGDWHAPRERNESGD